MPTSIKLHRQKGVARLELADAAGFPRLSGSLLDELGAALERLFHEPACQGIVIHGSEKCFAAGADISEVGALTGATALPFARRTQLLFERMPRARKPVVAAIAGYCLGGGFDLALACHWRVATPEARLGHPGATLGLLTGWGGTQRLPRLIGRAQALELLLRGEAVSGADALRRGIVDELAATDKVVLRATERAQKLAAESGAAPRRQTRLPAGQA